MIERYGTVRQRWQDTAAALKDKLQQLTDTRPGVSAVEADVAGERVAVARVDELRALLAPHPIGCPALPAAREDLAEELNGLLTANPVLRFDPVLREERWTTILEQAQAAEEEQLGGIGAQLDEALLNIADNTAIITGAASVIDQQRELCVTLREALNANTPGGPAPQSRQTLNTRPSPESGQARRSPLRRPASPRSGPTPRGVAVRHEQMQLPVETPAITEGLGI